MARFWQSMILYAEFLAEEMRGTRVLNFMCRILVIEDENDIRWILEKILKENGCEVVAAEDGDKGLELFEEIQDFDLVITDIRMPGKDGNEVARHIRGSGRFHIPIVAITGCPNETQKEFFDLVISKPMKLEDLTEMIAYFKEKTAHPR